MLNFLEDVIVFLMTIIIRISWLIIQLVISFPTACIIIIIVLFIISKSNK